MNIKSVIFMKYVKPFRLLVYSFSFIHAGVLL